MERNVGANEMARWRRAALLHDALKDAPPETLERWVPQGDWPSALWHGPAAAAAAAAHGETDQGVLDAVRYHSVGFTGWDDVGRILYLADYLEPGRPQQRARRDAWTGRVATDLEGVLLEVAAARMSLLSQRGNPVRPETIQWWNQLAGGASPSPSSSSSA
jgi:HD superfamily phosphohydrolase YqeK